MKNNELKVMTLNLLTDKLVLHDNPPFSKRIKSIECMIEQFNPDIICVQELTQTMIPFMETILNTYQMVGEYRHCFYSNEGNQILYRKDRFTQLETNTLWLSNTPYHKGSKFLFSQFPRITTYVTLKDNQTNKTFTVFNTHLDALFNSIRKKQLEVLMKLIQDNSDTFTILCGDFNTTSTTLHPITDCYLKDLTPDSIGSTLRGKQGSKRYQNKPIDHILISNTSNISYSIFKIINSYNDVYPTDHYPVFVNITY